MTVLADVKPTVFDISGNRKHGIDAKTVNDMLAKYGAKSWELVNTTSINSVGTTIQISFLFKKIGTAETNSEFRRIRFYTDGDGVNEIVSRG